MNRCAYCDSTAFHVITEKCRFQEKRVLRCDCCNLVYLELDHTENQILEHYRHDYRKDKEQNAQENPHDHYNNPIISNDVKNRMKWISDTLLLKGKKVLEIGSASGGLVRALQDAGADVVGVELTSDYVAYARDLGLKIIDRPLTTQNFSNRFDLVVSFHCIEHIPVPAPTFSAILQALKPHGTFMGEVPNMNDWRIKIFNNSAVKRLHYDPNHYLYYTADTLDAFLRKAGFTTISTHTVERYNSIIQLKRILGVDYSQAKEETAVKQDVFADYKNDVRLKTGEQSDQEMLFNAWFERLVGHEKEGNCLRWIAGKD